MIYLLLGEDIAAKDAKIADIRQKHFTATPDAPTFDFDNLDAKDLSVDALKKSLLTLPVIASKRLIVLRQIHKLKPADITVLLNFCVNPLSHVDVVLESSESTLKGELKDIPLYAKGTVLGAKKADNVFDMTKLISSRRTADALKMLDGFYTNHMHPLQVMGALVWFWSKDGRAYGTEKFERGLKALEEADLNIKRSRMNPEHAVEKLVVELVELSRR